MTVDQTKQGGVEQAATQLIEHTVDEMKELVKDEVRASKREAVDAARELAPGAALLGAGAALVLCGAGALFVFLGLALSRERAGGTALVGLGLLGAAAGCAYAGLSQLSERPLERFAGRVERDLAAEHPGLNG